MLVSEPTAWELDRFGAVAHDLRNAVVASMHQAHARALGAHIGGGGRTEHAYGTQFAVAQFEELADATRTTDGVTLRKPKDSTVQYELPLVVETKTVLYPLRYGKDGKVKREGAKISMSKVRRDLLHTNSVREPENQLDLLQPALSDDEYARRRAFERAFQAELSKNGRVVTVGVSCSPDGVFDLYWGDVDVDEDSGKVTVRYFEPLAHIDLSVTNTRPRPTEITPSAAPRFDEDTDDRGVELIPHPAPAAASGDGFAASDEIKRAPGA